MANYHYNSMMYYSCDYSCHLSETYVHTDRYLDSCLNKTELAHFSVLAKANVWYFFTAFQPPENVTIEKAKGFVVDL
jgi:hypothetical protein